MNNPHPERKIWRCGDWATWLYDGELYTQCSATIYPECGEALWEDLPEWAQAELITQAEEEDGL